MAASLKDFITGLPRLTFMGYNVLFITAVVGFFAFSSGYSLIVYSCAVLASVSLLSFIFCYYSLHGISLSRFIKGSFTAGDLFLIEYSVKNSSLLFPAFHLLITDCCANGVFRNTYYNFKAETGLVPPDGRGFATCSGRIRERGILEFDTVRVSTRFPFGIFYCIREFSLPETIRSYPRCRTIKPKAVFTGEVTGYSELPGDRWERGYDIFRGVREYRWGDNPRWIDWKTSAKYRNQLRVREFATTEEREIFVVFDPVSGWLSRKSKNVKFEISLVYTVSLIKYFLDRGNQVTFYTLDRGFVEVPQIRTLHDFRNVLSLTASIKEKKGFDFHQDLKKRSDMMKHSGGGVIVIGAGIRALYEEMFRGHNVRVVDVTEQNIRSLFPMRRIVV